MSDIFSKQRRHEIMSSIRSKDTKPELLFRRALFAQGFRYRISTPQWYRDLSAQNESLKESIEELQAQEQQAQRELGKVKSEVSKEKFKNSAAEVGSTLMDGVGSLLGGSKTKRLQTEVEELKAENAEIKEKMGAEITKLKTHIFSTEAEHKSAISKLSERLDKIYIYFPHLENLLNWEKFLKTMGLPQDMIRRLFNREEVVGSGELYSSEHSKKFKVEGAAMKLEQDPQNPSKIRLTINGTDIFDWFKQKQQELLKSIGINIEQRQGKGLKK